MIEIPLARPYVGDLEQELVAEVMRSGMLVQGQRVAELEEILAQQVHCKHALAVSSGTSALHLSLLALGIGPGDEVIVPAFSFVATANVVELVGAKPIFVDIDLTTYTLDVDAIEAAITPETRAIIPVHEFGLTCHLEQILEIASHHSLDVIEDAACALGAKYQGEAAGSFGKVSAFSLHPRKVVTAGEGGILTTSDDQIANYVYQMRNHGFGLGQSRGKIGLPGFNYRMSEIHAALAIGQMSRLDKLLLKRQQLADLYLQTLQGANCILPQVPQDRQHSWQTFHILLPNHCDQANIIASLRLAGIGSNLGAQCLPALDYYQDRYRLDVGDLFPNAHRAYTKGLALPLYEHMTAEEVERVSHNVRAHVDG